MNLLIVGFGNMGCRHAQSCLDSNLFSNIYIYELNRNIYIQNCKLIDADENKMILLENLETFNVKIDFAIIATTAKPRYDLTKLLIMKGVKYFLLEKVVFQSEKQFDNIINLLDKYKAKAYCNFVNRYNDTFNLIKKEFESSKNKKFKMFINGGNFGLSCNSLHYIDLFEYITNVKAELKNYKISESPNGNKRGKEYNEFHGQIIYSNKKSHTLHILDDKNKFDDHEIIFILSNSTYLIKYKLMKLYKLTNSNFIEISNFEVTPSSILTRIIINDIINDNIILPNVKQSRDNHCDFFEIINNKLNLSKDDICPIT
jgi:predicted dehydrogenase